MENIIKIALEEDLAGGLDITSAATIPEDAQATAQFCTRADGILAGLNVGLSVFGLVDPHFKITRHVEDGAHISTGQILATVQGNARALLTAERTALNFMTHLSGIATLTSHYVEAIAGTKAQITDTRKTVPGLRALEKDAVLAGGGQNHRMGLYDMFLIKDNHIAVAGSIAKALDKARAARTDQKIEIEVDRLDQLEEVLAHGGADMVLLDNMDEHTLKRAVKMAKGKTLTEASGGITLDAVRDIALTGVDFIAVGALTHSATALDIGLDIEV